MSNAHELEMLDRWPEPGKMPLPATVDKKDLKRATAMFGQARVEAYELLGVEPPRRKDPRLGRILKPPQKNTGRRFSRPCKGCGGSLDGYTPTCKHCSSRHAMRRWSQRKRAASQASQASQTSQSLAAAV